MSHDPLLDNKCENCRWYRDYECRRFPPLPTFWYVDNQPPKTPEPIFQFPQVGANFPACGEFSIAPGRSGHVG